MSFRYHESVSELRFDGIFTASLAWPYFQKLHREGGQLRVNSGIFISLCGCVFRGRGIEGVVCSLEGIHLADMCILTKL
jgi:hypothetical protein